MKLNKKGYMLVEIILASALAFGLAFFIIDLVIRLKNKNDDLLVETLITTDKTIITNKLMSYAKSETKNFDCNKLTITDNTVKYKDEVIDIITDYANVGELSCSTSNGKVSINIPLSVPQMPDKDYDITFDYKYEIGDITPPTCKITVSDTTITATFEDNIGGSGIKGETTKTATINGASKYTFTVEDSAGNSKSCSADIKNKVQSCPYDSSPVSGSCLKYVGAPVKECSVSGNFTWSESACNGAYDYSRIVCRQGTLADNKNGCYYYYSKVSSCPSGYSNISNSDYCYIKTE